MDEKRKPLKKRQGLSINFSELGILYALLIFWLILALTNENFRGLSFYRNILRQASFNAICGVGMTFAIISGDFDLSVASQVALCSVVMTLLIPAIGVVPSIFVVLLIGTLLGAFNGILIAKFKIPSFIATLATQFAYRALAQIINSSPVVVQNKGFTSLSVKYVAGIPLPFIIMTVIAVIGTVVLRKTRLGRNVLAIGNSKSAAKLSGINIDRTQIMVFLLVGLFTACSAVMFTSYLGSSNYGMQTGLEFTIITAVVLGGTALAGGKGSIFTTVVAAIFLVTIKSGMDAFGINSYTQKIIEGGILVLAFSITHIRSSISTALVRRRSRRELQQRLAAKK